MIQNTKAYTSIGDFMRHIRLRLLVVTIGLYGVTLTGCVENAVLNDNIIFEESANISESLSMQDKVDEYDLQNDKLTLEPVPMSVEGVRKLAEKGSSLSLEDFGGYNAYEETISTGNSYERTYSFMYKGRPMCLRLYASDKPGVNEGLANYLDSVVVFPKEFLGLRTFENELEFDGTCADIRNGNIDHILDGQVPITDYVQISLPEGFELSDYQFWLGTRGGAYQSYLGAEHI